MLNHLAKAKWKKPLFWERFFLDELQTPQKNHRNSFAAFKSQKLPF